MEHKEEKQQETPIVNAEKYTSTPNTIIPHNAVSIPSVREL